ncbi:hypothetical protein FHETE_3791 [Fusarium heterosporum]|uniref:Uncharacterized protein n=1 Tax=Fusarium heterosporum TaxID=42747 RepID=A0A8H5TLE0_FUSHE|nr:hypothetical protein FHETE_3791 [Fusarium heterosporum]
MPFKFNDTKIDHSGNYYYTDDDVKTVRLPLSTNCSGDIQMSHKQLKEWFSIAEGTLPSVPGYYISPRLNSTWGGYYSGNSGRGWWRVTGDVVVYKPVEWVACTERMRDFPKGAILTHIEKERTETTKTKLYAGAEFSLEVSGGGGFMGMKAEVKTKVSTGVEWEKEIMNKEKYTQSGDLGDRPLTELAVGLMLRAEEVYTHTIDIWVDDRCQEDSMGWSGGDGWEQIRIPSHALSRVEGLQFSGISMSGTGHSAGLYLQALPVFDERKEIKDLHIALSNAGWGDWYAYTVGRKDKGSGDRHLVAYPKYRPMATLMPLIDNSGKAEE